MRLSLVEGATYALMVGFGETYFLADAVRIGATRLQQGLVVTLPLCTGALGSVASLALLARARSRKRIVVASSFVQVAILVALALRGALSPTVLIGAVCLYQACGQATGTAWSSWYGDLVPKGIRGTYFARRNRFVHLFTCAGLVSAGFLLERLEPGAAGEVVHGAGGAGFRLVFLVAAAARLLSVLLLAASPELPFRGLTDAPQTLRFLATSRGSRAWRLLGTGAALQLMVYIASPYFGPFMLKDLRFTYLEYMASSVTVVSTKFLLLPLWGRLVDGHGSRQVYTLAAVLVAIVPLPWLWANGLLWIVPAQALSGFSWAGYEVAYFSTMLDTTTKRTRPYLFGLQNVLNGSMQLLGGLLGAALLAAAHGSFRVVFAASLVLRLAVALVAPRLVPAPRMSRPIGRRALFLRMIGIRAHGGAVHRPIDDGEGPGEG
ncbi:MAG TPA: MFS transporter [Planctomycetota bacterium]|nr:MFS transporter [Planctomycetota bacterium]